MRRQGSDPAIVLGLGSSGWIGWIALRHCHHTLLIKQEDDHVVYVDTREQGLFTPSRMCSRH
jgi:hypothetical protein